MANNVHIKLNNKGINELLRSDDVANYCKTVGEGIASNAGVGYETRVHFTKQRAIVNVYADTDEAKQDNLDNNTLLKAIGRYNKD